MANIGSKWTKSEELLLLEELNKNISIEDIAKNHKRAIGGINARRGKIAYDLHSNDHSIESIMMKTKLDKNEILDAIKRKQNNEKNIFNEIVEIKNTLKLIKSRLFGNN